MFLSARQHDERSATASLDPDDGLRTNLRLCLVIAGSGNSARGSQYKSPLATRAFGISIDIVASADESARANATCGAGNRRVDDVGGQRFPQTISNPAARSRNLTTEMSPHEVRPPLPIPMSRHSVVPSAAIAGIQDTRPFEILRPRLASTLNFCFAAHAGRPSRWRMTRQSLCRRLAPSPVPPAPRKYR
jgi:hypothetical protein